MDAIESEKMVRVIDMESLKVAGLSNIGFGHIQIICECGQKWGVRVDENGMIPETNLHCFKCDAKKFREMAQSK